MLGAHDLFGGLSDIVLELHRRDGFRRTAAGDHLTVDPARIVVLILPS